MLTLYVQRDSGLDVMTVERLDDRVERPAHQDEYVVAVVVVIAVFVGHCRLGSSEHETQNARCHGYLVVVSRHRRSLCKNNERGQQM